MALVKHDSLSPSAYSPSPTQAISLVPTKMPASHSSQNTLSSVPQSPFSLSPSAYAPSHTQAISLVFEHSTLVAKKGAAVNYGPLVGNKHYGDMLGREAAALNLLTDIVKWCGGGEALHTSSA